MARNIFIYFSKAGFGGSAAPVGVSGTAVSPRGLRPRVRGVIEQVMTGGDGEIDRRSDDFEGARRTRPGALATAASRQGAADAIRRHGGPGNAKPQPQTS